MSLPNAPSLDRIRKCGLDRGIKFLAVVELAAGAVRADEQEIRLTALIGVGDSVCLPATCADTAHPRALRAAEYAHVAAGSPIRVHAHIILQGRGLWYWPNGGHRFLRCERKTAGALPAAPAWARNVRASNIPRRVAGKTCRRRGNVASGTRCAVPSVWSSTKEIGLKGSQKPKSAQKKPAQKTLKERRSAKKAAAKIRGIAE
jgi:hypothetical protein